MALGRLLTRSTRYVVSDTVTGATSTFFVQDNLAPDWPSSDAYRGAMSIPGAWRAATLLSGLLGRLPWDAYRKFGGRDEEKLEPCPPLLEQPNPPETRMSSFRSWGLDYLWHGNAVGVVAARSPLGWPTAAIPVPAVSVGVRRITPYTDSNLPVGSLEYSIGSARFTADEVIHFKGPCQPGAVRGMGVLESHINTLTLAADQNRQARGVTNHGVPTGVLQTELDPEVADTDQQAKDVKSEWMASQATRTIAVLSKGMEFKPLSWNPQEMDMIAARKFTLNELELIFGLPVGWLGGTDSSRKYSNMSQDDVAFMKWSMGDHLEQFEQTLSAKFPRGTTVRANQDAVLQADTLTRYQAHTLALDPEKGWMERNEVRELEKRPPLPDKPEQPDAMIGGPEEPGAGQVAA